MTTFLGHSVPYYIAFWPSVPPFGPPMWQAEVDNVRCMSASPAKAVGQKALSYGSCY